MKIESAVFVTREVPASVTGKAAIEANSVVTDPVVARRIVSAGLPHRVMSGTPLDSEEEPEDANDKPDEHTSIPSAELDHKEA